MRPDYSRRRTRFRAVHQCSRETRYRLFPCSLQIEVGCRTGGSMSHTPGPWEAEEYAELSEYSINTGERQIARTNGYGGLSNSEHTANAHLISAAPELLEALKKCRTMAIEFGAPAVCWAARHKKWMKEIESAIAKAEGRQ